MRALLEVAVVATIIATSLSAVRHLRLGTRSVETNAVVLGIVCLAAVSAVCVWTRTWRLGLGRVHFWRHVGAGALYAVPVYLVTAVATVLMGGVALAGGWETAESLIAAKRPAFDAVASVNPLAVVPIGIGVACYEEIVFRGFLLGRLITVLGTGSGIVATSVAFGLLHAGSQGWLGAVQTTCCGAMFAVIALRRGSVWPAIACHAAVALGGVL